MDDLLQSQIYESCKLALPNGLKELMSDISREVLRAQPPNLYDFITKYLAALLVSRENLSVAGRLCNDICDPDCHFELENELRNIGLSDEDVVKAMEVIEKYFEKGGINESCLMVKLVKKVDISEDQLEMVQEAIRDAFLQHHVNKTKTFPEIPSNGDQIKRAANHTLQLYSETGPSEADYDQKAKRIQAAYRAYGVRRLCKAPNKDNKIIRFNPDAARHADSDDSNEKEDEVNTFEETETQSQIDLYQGNNEVFISHTNYEMANSEHVQAFVNYDDEVHKTSVTSEDMPKDAVNETAYNNDFNDDTVSKSSSISEVHFREQIEETIEIHEECYIANSEENENIMEVEDLVDPAEIADTDSDTSINSSGDNGTDNEVEL